ncbi:MAG: hypothetical protein E7057_10270 [Lentisphaerae bacterium]|nr:hypothetical protein [Lentisphaerota bacterium]
MIFNGISFTIVTGIIWTMLAVIYSGVASKQKSITGFMFLYSAFFTVLIWIFQFPQAVSLKEFSCIALAMVPSALAGLAGFQLLYQAMRHGSHAVAWTFTQSAMIWPCLGGWLIFHQPVRYLNLAGLLLIIAALCCLGISQNKDAEKKNSLLAIMLCIAAMIMQGISQFCTLFPGEWQMSKAALSWRLPVLALTGFIAWAIAAAIIRPALGKAVIKSSTIYSLVVAAGQITLFIAIDALTPVNMTGIVYPAAISICIILFALYCAVFRKEKLSIPAISGLTLLLAGVILLFWH